MSTKKPAKKVNSYGYDISGFIRVKLPTVKGKPVVKAKAS